MSMETLPLDLYKANVELQLRITRLLQEGGHRWLESVQKSSMRSMEQTTAEIEGLLQTGNWQSLATLPADTFWRLFQHGVNDSQTVNQLAIQNQTEFTSGLQEALEAWQKSVMTVVSNTSAAVPMMDIFKQWGAPWANAASASDTKKGA
ncbi:phasin family protein [Alcaligenes faecalis]|nr:phasin family protein [Alcaligenes faecalis]QFY78784.1 phasin family protein [Alcaligenes faecalis]